MATSPSWRPGDVLLVFGTTSGSQCAIGHASRLLVRWPAASLGYGLLACAATWPPCGTSLRICWDRRPAISGFTSGTVDLRHKLSATGTCRSRRTICSPSQAAPTSPCTTTRRGLFGLPLVGPLGVVSAFNLVLLLCVALSGLGMFVLGRHLGLRSAAAWTPARCSWSRRSWWRGRRRISAWSSLRRCRLPLGAAPHARSSARRGRGRRRHRRGRGVVFGCVLRGLLPRDGRLPCRVAVHEGGMAGQSGCPAVDHAGA